MTPEEESASRKITAKLQKLSIGTAASGHSRHIFLCTGDSCSASGEGEKSWEHLKSKLTEKGLSPGNIFRTKVGCLRLCAGGPIGLIYPEGTWYRGLTPQAIDRVVEEDLLNGRPVKELVVAVHPLTIAGQNSDSSSSIPSE